MHVCMCVYIYTYIHTYTFACITKLTKGTWRTVEEAEAPLADACA